MPSKPQFLKAARWYAAHGFQVFPLRPCDKKPLTSHGFKDASKDPERISAWWQEQPDANIGLPTGAASRLLLLDLDYRNGSVVEDRADVIRLFGPIPDTCEVITGSGGRHIYFRYDGGKVPKQIAKGVELKGDGGYAVAPPSIHPNGTEYSFDGTEGAKALLKVADPPAWLLAAIADGRADKSKMNPSAEQWSEGERNNRLTSLAGKLRRSGLSREEIEAALVAINCVRCVPPLADAELRKIAASIAKYPTSKKYFARVNVDALKTIDELNGLDIFGGLLQFVGVDCRGPMIVARFADGVEAVFHSLTDLTSFARAQVILAQATRVLIPTPARRNIRTDWEPAVQLILRLAGKDQTMNADKLREEFRDILHMAWERAQYPHTADDAAFFAMLRLCYSHQRDPKGPPPSCAVWHDGKDCYVHQMSLIEWLSTPGGRNRHYDWGDVRNALLLLDFVPEQVHRSLNKEHAKVRLWRGPLDLLIDDETRD
jgi:hypothetical protein